MPLPASPHFLAGSRRDFTTILCFLTPVFNNRRDGFLHFEPRVVSTMLSFLPDFAESRPNIFLFARPMNLEACTPVRLPRSAERTSPALCLLFLMNELWFLMHSQSNC